MKYMIIVLLLCLASTVRAETALGTFKLTGYNCDVKSCGQWAKYRKFANGQSVDTIHQDMIVCAAPRGIKFGTVLRVEGIGLVTCVDRGRAIKGPRLDIFFQTRKDALNFGVKKATVWREN